MAFNLDVGIQVGPLGPKLRRKSAELARKTLICMALSTLLGSPIDFHADRLIRPMDVLADTDTRARLGRMGNNGRQLGHWRSYSLG